MNKCKIHDEKKLLLELQDVSEKISDLISQCNFKSILPLEKQRLKILKSFHVKPSDSGIKLIKEILVKNKKEVSIIENEKYKLGENFNNVKKIFLAYGK